MAQRTWLSSNVMRADNLTRQRLMSFKPQKLTRKADNTMRRWHVSHFWIFFGRGVRGLWANRRTLLLFDCQSLVSGAVRYNDACRSESLTYPTITASQEAGEDRTSRQRKSCRRMGGTMACTEVGLARFHGWTINFPDSVMHGTLSACSTSQSIQ